MERREMRGRTKTEARGGGEKERKGRKRGDYRQSIVKKLHGRWRP